MENQIPRQTHATSQSLHGQAAIDSTASSARCLSGQAAIELHPCATARPLHGQAAIELPSATAGTLRGQAAIELRCGTTARPLHGQAAIEMLVMAAFALAFILPIAFLFLTSSGSEMSKFSLLQAKATVRAIASEAGEVYLQGNGSKKTILVNYPEGMKNASIKGGVVSLTMNAEGRDVDVVAYTFANITGDLSAKHTAGVSRISLVNVDGKYVNITYG